MCTHLHKNVYVVILKIRLDRRKARRWIYTGITMHVGGCSYVWVLFVCTRTHKSKYMLLFSGPSELLQGKAFLPLEPFLRHYYCTAKTVYFVHIENIYTHTHTHIYIHVCTHTHFCGLEHVICLYMHEYTYIYMLKYVCICTRVGLCSLWCFKRWHAMRMYQCIRVYALVYARVCTRVYVRVFPIYQSRTYIDRPCISVMWSWWRNYKIRGSTRVSERAVTTMVLSFALAKAMLSSFIIV
jgi:hypothetical protein